MFAGNRNTASPQIDLSGHAHPPDERFNTMSFWLYQPSVKSSKTSLMTKVYPYADSYSWKVRTVLDMVRETSNSRYHVF